MPAQKLILYVARPTSDGAELLVWGDESRPEVPWSPLAGGETAEASWKRVAGEMAGLGDGLRVRKRLGRAMVAVPSGPDGSGPVETQIFHGLLVDPGKNVPASWKHRRPDGSEVSCHWIAVTPELKTGLVNFTHVFAAQVAAALDVDDE